MSKDTGGQAFPDGVFYPDRNHAKEGMTLRDYLMVHAPEMPTWYLNKEAPHQNDFDSDLNYERIFFSWRTYYADAMITQRNK